MRPSRLLEPVDLGPRTARNRLLFGPHVTNLGRRRAISERHVAYYARRAAGGCGVVVVEEASVHDSDWPYERAPLAVDCAEGWAAVARSVQGEGALAIAAIGHSGGQGSSAYSQRPLWAPSRVPEVATREVPKWMEPEDIAAVVAGFGAAAKLAAEAGLDGVEVNAGQHSLVRQFLSGLTNHRGDEWGTDRLRFAREVLAAVRAGLGPDRVLGLRLSCDELAPWAGITPEQAPGLAAELAPWCDYLVVVRGSIFSVQATRPDFHEPEGVNLELCRAVRAAAGGDTVVVLQGSVVDVAMAEQALAGGVADLVEMTRAQIADPDLGAKLAAGTPERIRPCLRCNQTCQVRDARNPIVTCVGEPSAGHETEDPDWTLPARPARDVVVVGGGPAGLEAARVAASRGHQVRLVERAGRLGGVAALAGPAAPLVAWLEAECRRLGVELTTGAAADAEAVAGWTAGGAAVVVATGGRRGRPTYELHDGAVVVEALTLWADPAALPAEGPVVVWDPIGGPIGVAAAERLGPRATLVTPDHVAGNELSRTGDLAPANVRLAQLGVAIERRAVLRAVTATSAEIEDRFTGARRSLDAVAVVDAGHRLPGEPWWGDTQVVRAGDVVAPRTVHEAVLEGRRAALAVDRLGR